LFKGKSDYGGTIRSNTIHYLTPNFIFSFCIYKAKAKSYGLWPMAYGLWPMAYGLWPMAYGLWPMAYGLWPMAYGLWRVVKSSFIKRPEDRILQCKEKNKRLN